MFIGIEMDKAEIREALEECLLTDEEFATGPQAWMSLPDPFPRWDLSVEDALAART